METGWKPLLIFKPLLQKLSPVFPHVLQDDFLAPCGLRLLVFESQIIGSDDAEQSTHRFLCKLKMVTQLGKLFSNGLFFGHLVLIK